MSEHYPETREVVELLRLKAFRGESLTPTDTLEIATVLDASVDSLNFMYEAIEQLMERR